MNTVNAFLVTETGRQPGLLSADQASIDADATITVDGVAYAPEDLPNGAYLLIEDAEVAARAARAGFALEPPSTTKRRIYRVLGKFIGATLLLCAVWALVLAVPRFLALDLLGAVLSVGLSLFLVLLGLYWWSYGEVQLRRDAVPRGRRSR